MLFLDTPVQAAGDILVCRNISKAFGGTKALRAVDFTVRRGEVHALLGENGAGKSTLMKVIMGLYKPDGGEIEFEGKPYHVSGPANAISAGIAMIHQELSPEPHLSVAENIFLHREDTFKGTPFLNKKQTNRKAREILERYHFPVSPKAIMGSLTLAQMQMIEIIKAASSDARLVIMDEPTSSLDSEETQRLFKTIRELKAEGISIVYISHRMEEIFEICERVSVFRDGSYVATKNIGDVSREELISLMVGHKVESIFPKQELPIGEAVLKVEGFCGNGFHDINFEVHRGEILGISGLVGSGRSETMRALFGLDKKQGGRVLLNGKEVDIDTPGAAIAQGIAMVNEDRAQFGLCLLRSIRENISLPTLRARQRGLLINRAREKKETAEVAGQLTVKAAGLEADAYSLSGGNQQKVVLAKWVMARPVVLILDEPTRGVDVGAKSEIHALMGQFAKEGMAIIMVSSELPEVMGMSDRVLTYHEGTINGEFCRADILCGKVTQQTILDREFGGSRKGRENGE